ncbi:MAG: hypothetical protein U0Q55_08570 [Vicinamibacterales bacterium]
MLRPVREAAAQGALTPRERAGAARTRRQGRMPEAAQDRRSGNRPAATPAAATPPATTPAAAARRPAPTAPPGRQQPSHAADVASIQTLLEQYADAYAKMDVNALRAVWPGTSPTLSFAGNKSYTMSLRNPQLQVNGDVATVAAVRHTVQELENGQKREASVPITMNLRRISGGWVIDTIQ